MRKVLILGAGSAQVDAINHLVKKGYEVYGCSNSDADRGVPLFHHFEAIDIADREKVAEYAERTGVGVVYSVGSDIAMPTVSYVSETLNLPHFVSYETSSICNSKHSLRAFLGENFTGNLKFITAETLGEALAFDAYPCMLKPVDSQGQRGVYRIDSKDGLRENFEKAKRFSRSGRVILEQFVEGREVSVNAYMLGGMLAFSIVSDRISFDEFPGGIVSGHRLPTGITDKKALENIGSLVNRTIHRLSILNGPVYFQIKLRGSDAYLIEVTPRLDGCHMWNLIRRHCGVDLLSAAFAHLAGQKRPYLTPTSAVPHRLDFMCLPPGAAVDRGGFCVNGACFVEWYYENGDLVRPINGYMEKCGYAIRKDETANGGGS